MLDVDAVLREIAVLLRRDQPDRAVNGRRPAASAALVARNERRETSCMNVTPWE
jgi:hypothetical protein